MLKSIKYLLQSKLTLGEAILVIVVSEVIGYAIGSIVIKLVF